MDSDKDVMEAFQKALEQAQKNPEPKQTPAYEAAEENSDGGLIFSGSVSPDTTMSTQSNPASFTVHGEKEESSNQFWGLFLAGMIILPAITWIISAAIIGYIEDDDYDVLRRYTAESSVYNDNVTIREEIYYVHEAHLGDGFGYELAENRGAWSISIEGIIGNDTWGSAVIRGHDDQPGALDTWLDDDGNLWHNMDAFLYTNEYTHWSSYYGGECEWEGGSENWESDTRWWCKYEADDDWDDWWYYCENHDSNWHCTDDFGQSENYENSSEENRYYSSDSTDVNVYIKLDGDTVDIATNDSISPVWVSYWSEELEYEADEFRPILAVPVYIWPISLIGGIIWGFKTDRKPFAYGIMTAGMLALLLPVAAVIGIVLFFGYN